MRKITFITLSFFAISFISIITEQSADATASFARLTGASCNKCHTANFPRLTPKGERFMLNGFQLKEKATESFGFDDEKKDSSKKFAMPKIGNIFSITGQFNPIQLGDNHDTPVVGSPETVTLIANGTLAKDMPIWVGIDVGENGAEVHRYQLGYTNIGDSQLINFRMGTLDPTTWTSFYGHAAALESSSSGVGSYGSGHDENTGFATVGSGYAERDAIEYYGYNKKILWSLGMSNVSSHDETNPADTLDIWLTARYNIFKNSTISILWYNANGATEGQTITTAANIRVGKLDLMGQFSIDNSGGTIETETVTRKLSDKTGFTLQANYETGKKSMAIARYDTTDNGSFGDSVETHLTFAMVFKPEQNIKITTSMVLEVTAVALDSVTSASEGGHSHKVGARAAGHGETSETGETIATNFGDHFKINIRYMF